MQPTTLLLNQQVVPECHDRQPLFVSMLQPLPVAINANENARDQTQYRSDYITNGENDTQTDYDD